MSDEGVARRHFLMVDTPKANTPAVECRLFHVEVDYLGEINAQYLQLTLPLLFFP